MTKKINYENVAKKVTAKLQAPTRAKGTPLAAMTQNNPRVTLKIQNGYQTAWIPQGMQATWMHRTVDGKMDFPNSHQVSFTLSTDQMEKEVCEVRQLFLLLAL